MDQHLGSGDTDRGSAPPADGHTSVEAPRRAGVDSERSRMRGGEPIDAGRALGLLRQALSLHGVQTESTVPDGLVVTALRCAGVDGSDLALLSHHDVRTLWVDDRLPRPMTLGGVAVLGRAQRAQRAGATWTGAVRHAARSAQLLVGLVGLRPRASWARAGQVE